VFTIFAFVMFFVFGFFAIRHFRNGRFIWGVAAALGSLLFAGSVWVDYMRAAALSDGPAAPAQGASAQGAPTQAAPVIRDYDPGATADGASAPASTETPAP
jgi:hypothetical protein